MKYFLFTATFLLTIYNAKAQAYWQQVVDTKIEVTLDDKLNFLYGYEEMTYVNNSPDTLHYIYMHLWPNAYKNDRTPLAQQFDRNGQTNFYYSRPKDRGYIDSLQFIIDGQNVDYYSADNVPDIARIELINPLPPRTQMKISTPFRVKIPAVFSRLGHTGQAYFISQWFPKPAVYDRKGWHPLPFLDQGEFYSNYGSYDVSITVPKNYIVMATGNCEDAGEQQWLDSLSRLPIPDPKTYEDLYPPSASETKTLHFHEDNIHDFAWFADKRWIVRKDTVSTPGSPLITAWTAFLPQHQKSWAKGTDYLKKTVEYYGKWVGPYPYKTIKAVEGDMRAGGGMEYPTITIIDKGAIGSLKTVVVHEAGHNWFYGLLGTNERDHAWMDEGVNSFYEHKTTTAISLEEAANGTKTLVHNRPTISRDSARIMASMRLDNHLEKILYFEDVATHTDQPIETTSAAFAKLNYPADVYIKTPMMLDWLEGYMGEDAFREGMQDYFNTWKYKHPYPEDMQAVLQKHTSKSLDWFFNDILNTDKRIDYKITHAHSVNGKTNVTVHNNTGVNGPVKIDAYKDDSIVATVWSAPFTGDTTLTLSINRDQWTRLHVSNIVPDGKMDNNTYRPNALFHHFGLRLNPIAGLNTNTKDKLYIAPALAYNKYDGFQLGLLFHDLTVPENRFRYALAPMYAFNSNTVTGAGSMGYLWYPGNLFKEIMLQVDGKSFDYDQSLPGPPKTFARYAKVAPSLNFTFNEHNPLSTVTRELTLKAYYITEQNFNYSIDSLAKPSLSQQEKVYGLLRYKHTNDRTYNPFSYSLEGQMGQDFAKINAEGNIRIDYYAKNKSLYVRGYIGKFFPISNDVALTQRYDLNATFSGMNDYLYDDVYFGRNTTMDAASQQVSMREGGFKIPTFNNVGRSSDWMGTLNLKSDLPLGRLPIRLFLDAGLIPNTTPDISNPGDVRVIYDGGIEVYFVKDIVCVYFPLIMSSDFRDYLKNAYGNNDAFTRSISFTLNLQNINWLKLPSKAIKLGVN